MYKLPDDSHLLMFSHFVQMHETAFNVLLHKSYLHILLSVWHYLLLHWMCWTFFSLCIFIISAKIWRVHDIKSTSNNDNNANNKSKKKKIVAQCQACVCIVNTQFEVFYSIVRYFVIAAQQWHFNSKNVFALIKRRQRKLERRKDFRTGATNYKT